MKMLSFVIIVGFILLYFLNIAVLKTSDINWFTHSWLRFLTGLLILGILSFYAHALMFKKSIRYHLDHRPCQLFIQLFHQCLSHAT